MASVSCGRFAPIDTDSPRLPPELLEGMYVRAFSWPDTMKVGEVESAGVEVFLADGRPILPDGIFWAVDSVRIAELYPTADAAAKQVRAVGGGTAIVQVEAWVYQPHGEFRGYSAFLRRPVVVVP